MTTSTRYAFTNALLRAEAVSALEAVGYQCTVDDRDDQWLLTVEHPGPDWATVRWTILQADPTAAAIPD